MAIANKKRQKHNFILTSPSRPKFSLSYKKKSQISSLHKKSFFLLCLEPRIFFSYDYDNFQWQIKGDTR